MHNTTSIVDDNVNKIDM